MLSSPTLLPSAADVVVVGAGIVGLAHAFEAHRQGRSVVVLDRDARPAGASIRNFGHACVTAQPESLRDLARSSREGWLTMSRRTGIPVDEAGAVVLAGDRADLDVLESFAAARPGDATLLDRSDLDDELAGLAGEQLRGGLRLRHDLRVDPRTTAPRLAGWLEAAGVPICWRHNVIGVQTDSIGTRVDTNRGTIRAEQVVLCSGHDLDHLFPAVADEHRVERCSLQMTRLAAPGPQVRPALLTATSVLRYGAFGEVADLAPLRRHLESTAPGLLAAQANLMLTQLPDGTLLVGDSHDYAATPEPFLSAAVEHQLHTALARLLKTAALPVLERWQGVYASSPATDVLDVEPWPGLRLITVTSGVGMTLSFGLARRTFPRP